MASKRLSLQRALLSTFINLNLVEERNTFNRWLYLDEVNDFPTICLISRGETRFPDQSASDVSVMTIALRGYIYDEDSITAAEALGCAIEDALEEFKLENPCSFRDIRLVEFRTDEGLYAPYGILDMQFSITYDVPVL